MKRTAILGLYSLVFVIATAIVGVAQPSEAQIKKDISGERTISITFGKPGSRTWDTSSQKWIWTRDYTIKSKTEDPAVTHISTGYAAYNANGAAYTFWRVFPNSSRFEGIPNPTAQEIQALIDKFTVQEIFGSFNYGNVVGKIESFGPPADPKFDWHTMNSVSFDLVGVYTQKTNGIGGTERGQRTFRIRLYRDDRKSPWKKFLTTSSKDWKVL
jgi:hypothetical protein